ncbi:MAG: tetraacyldisaccharide 4'-kinase [Pseudomonadota bacterium]
MSGTSSLWWPKPDEPASLSRGLAKALLYIPSALYGQTVANRMAMPGKQAALPVICVGNFIAGGAGKTPTALAIAAMMSERGIAPAFISRGYGGTLTSGSTRVEPERHNAAETGDEPLLLARQAPTWVGTDRLASIAAASENGARCAILDDGLQNPGVIKNLAFAVVDGRSGVGNGLCHPAGPLRAPLDRQMDHVDAVVLIGEGNAAAPAVRRAAQRGKPVLSARMEIEVAEHLREKPVMAYCGIGRPEKFFDSLKSAGLDVVHGLHFADHHRYTKADAERLIRDAQSRNALLVTTEKDHLRLKDAEGVLADLANLSTAIPAQLSFEDPAYIGTLLDADFA